MSRSKLGIDVEDMGIAKILSDNHFKVPPNQRPYKWEETHVQKLYEDFSSAFAKANEAYFLGTICLTQPTGTEQRLEVADGQQRLATTSILIAAIRDFLYESGGEHERKTAEKYTTTYLLDYDETTQESTPKLILSHADNTYFLKKILHAPQERKKEPKIDTLSNKRLSKAAEIAKSHVEKITGQFAKADKTKELIKWIQFLREFAIIISIQVPTQMNAYRMFETLNDRGLKASQIDILKNFLFQTSQSDVGELESKWTSMIATIDVIGDEDLQLTYLRHYWAMNYGYIERGELGERIQSQITSKRQALDMIIDLDNCASDYVGLLSPIGYTGWPQVSAKSRQYINIIANTLEIEQIRPLLMAIVQKFEPDKIEPTLKMLLSWSVRFLIGGVGGGGPLDRGYFDAARDVNSGVIKNPKQLRERIRTGIVRTDEEFKEAFEKLRASTNKLARYYLRALELFEQGDTNPDLGGVVEDTVDWNIEHIMPMRPSEYWSVSEDDQQSYKKRLGNMTLMNPKNNVKIGNNSFVEKKKMYKKSTDVLTQRILKNQEWGPVEIQKRQEELAELAAKIWNQ